MKKTQSAKEAGSRAPAGRAGPSKARGGTGRPSAPGSGKVSRPKKRTEPTGVFNGEVPEDIELDRYPVLGLRVYEVVTLAHDPRNARTHDKANVAAIRGSLRKYGQRKNIVVTADGEVKAGNGTLEAARAEGWKHIVGGPSPVDLVDARGFALADNRTAELAGWDSEMLGEEISFLAHEESYGVEGLGEIDFDKIEVGGYLRTGTGDDTGPQLKDGLTYQIVVACKGETHQAQLLAQFGKKGLECRPLIL